MSHLLTEGSRSRVRFGQHGSHGVERKRFDDAGRTRRARALDDVFRIPARQRDEESGSRGRHRAQLSRDGETVEQRQRQIDECDVGQKSAAAETASMPLNAARTW